MKFNPRPCPTIMVKSKVTGGPITINYSQFEEEGDWKEWTDKMQEAWDAAQVEAEEKKRALKNKVLSSAADSDDEADETEESKLLRRRIKKRVKPDKD